MVRMRLPPWAQGGAARRCRASCRHVAFESKDCEIRVSFRSVRASKDALASCAFAFGCLAIASHGDAGRLHCTGTPVQCLHREPTGLTLKTSLCTCMRDMFLSTLHYSRITMCTFIFASRTLKAQHPAAVVSKSTSTTSCFWTSLAVATYPWL